MKRVLRRAVIDFSVRNRRRKAALITDYIRQARVATVILVDTRPADYQRNGSIVEMDIGRQAYVLSACDFHGGRSPRPFVRAERRDRATLPADTPGGPGKVHDRVMAPVRATLDE